MHMPHYWSNRVYETIGRGGFYISADWGLEEEFTPRLHYIPYEYGNLEDLKQKIDYYLLNGQERENIRQAGFEWCKLQYTYKRRCEKLLETVKAELSI